MPTAPLVDDTELRELFLYGLSARVAALSVDNRSSGAGAALSAFRGTGLEYEESRAYVVGDEPRFINWRLSARTGNLQTRIFREERRRAVLIVIDRRSGMRFGTCRRLKLVQAVRAAAVIAARAHCEHETVETLLLDGSLRWSPPQSTEQGILSLLRHAVSDDGPPEHAGEEVNIEELLDRLEERLTPGMSLWLLSDLSGFGQRNAPGLLRLAAEHRFRVVLLQDPAELALPDAGRLRFSGHDGEFELDTSDPSIRNDYSQAAGIYFAQQQALFSDLGITCATLSTRVDEPEELLNDGGR